MQSLISQFQKVKEFICKDTGEKNESPKLIVVVRILNLSMLCYILLNSIIYIPILNNRGIVISLLSFTVFSVLFIVSYKQKTVYTLFFFNLSLIGWIIINIRYFGWDISTQHFLLILLVLCFYSGYARYSFKFSYAVVLGLIRIYLYFYSHLGTPTVKLTAGMNYTLQIINTIMLFWCLSFIVYMFSKDSQTLEGKLVNYNAELNDQANRDALTGLYNRRKAREYLEKTISPSNEVCTSLCICDIDFFKRVNDNYGHDVGDVVLKRLAETMQNVLRKDCFVSRWGGEEFLIVFPASNGDDAYVALERLRSKIKAMEFEAKDVSFGITMTFGLAEYDFRSDIDAFIKEADEKLYLGKGNGRDQIVF